MNNKLNKNVVMCKHCVEMNKNNKVMNVLYAYVGYYTILKVPENNKCLECGEELSLLNITLEELDVIYKISNDPSFMEAMNDLKEKDIIEYNVKLSQFKTQLDQQTREKSIVQSSNHPKCPTCGSSNIEKISVGKKAFGGAMFGIFSSDVRKSMHCKNCGYKW